MAKRFTDNEKWKKPFIKELSTLHKVVWFYILDECNHAGIWEVEADVMNARLKETVNLEEFLIAVGDKIKVFEGGRKWFIQDFVDFQYGELFSNNRVHLSIITVLKKYGLLKKKPLTSPLQGAKDKDKDMDKDKDKDNIHCSECNRTFLNELTFRSHQRLHEEHKLSKQAEASGQ